MSWSPRPILAALGLLGGMASAARGEDPPNGLLPVVNAGFREWTSGVPNGWTVEVGARLGDGPSSTLTRIAGGGLQLRSDHETRVWKLVSQTVPLMPDTYYHVRYWARAEGLRREAGQFDSAYVGVQLLDPSGKSVQQLIQPVPEGDFSALRLAFRSHGAASAKLTIFLSKSGSLDVTDVLLQKVFPAASYWYLSWHLRSQHEGDGDPTFRAALEALRAKMGQEGPR